MPMKFKHGRNLMAIWDFGYGGMQKLLKKVKIVKVSFQVSFEKFVNFIVDILRNMTIDNLDGLNDHSRACYDAMVEDVPLFGVSIY
jgi:hypothetical protein